jgi:hypothetical protein
LAPAISTRRVESGNASKQADFKAKSIKIWSAVNGNDMKSIIPVRVFQLSVSTASVLGKRD